MVSKLHGDLLDWGFRRPEEPAVSVGEIERTDKTLGSEPATLGVYGLPSFFIRRISRRVGSSN